MTREEFKSLNADGQWLWVIKNKAQVKLISLDNDATYVECDCFKEPGNSECTGSITMRSWLGNSWGIDHLLNALEIQCEGV